MTTTTLNPRITAIFDYIIEVSGEYPYQQNTFYNLKSNPNLKGFLIHATKENAYLLISDESTKYQIGDEIIPSSNKTSVLTSKNYFGNIIDIYGNVIYPENQSQAKLNSADWYPNEGNPFNLAHSLSSVQTLNEQLYTGVIAIDLLIPIGKGQRELIIGDRQTGKTFLALNTIINQRQSDVKNIYVAIGIKKQELASIYEMLNEYDVMKNTIIISAASTNSYEQYLVPYIAMAHAENISFEDDVLIVFDDLTKHANIFREIALLIDKPVGKEAFPSDVFFAHSSLLERAGKFKNKKTITALPIVQTVDNDITSLISSNIISITDGQIVTNSELFSSGKLPAIDIELSVSRTGSSVQNYNITKVAGEINKIYRSYKRNLKLTSLKYDLNKETASLLSKGEMVEKMFNQVGVSLYSHKLILLTSKLISWGTFESVGDSEVALKFVDYLIENDRVAKSIYAAILENGEVNDDNMRDYFENSLEQFAKYNNLDWKLESRKKFIDLSPEFLLKATMKVGIK
ncbi:MSC_0619 family F1-like ATPase alpha subunit [Metamycoplasma arthritidis]